MAGSKIVKANRQIAKAVTNGFHKIEDGVVNGYRKVEDGVTGVYQKLEDGFVARFLTAGGASAAERDARAADRGKAPEKTCEER